jgi:hypothetical protein
MRGLTVSPFSAVLDQQLLDMFVEFKKVLPIIG